MECRCILVLKLGEGEKLSLHFTQDKMAEKCDSPRVDTAHWEKDCDRVCSHSLDAYIQFECLHVAYSDMSVTPVNN